MDDSEYVLIFERAGGKVKKVFLGEIETLINEVNTAIAD